MFRKIIFLSFIILYFLLCNNNLLYSQVIEQKIPEIWIITWRKITNAETGFMEHFTRSGKKVNFVIKETFTDKEKLKEIIEEIRIKKPDLVYCFGTTAAKMICGTVEDHNEIDFINDIPIVFCVVSAPVNSKIIPDLKSSKRNVTGVVHLVPYLIQLKSMKLYMDFKNIAAIYNKNEQNSTIAIDFLEKNQKEYKYKLNKFPFLMNKEDNPDPEKIEENLKNLIQSKPDLVYLPSDSFLIKNMNKIIDFLNENSIPTFSATEVPVRNAGALTGLVCPYFNCGLFAGYKAEQILFKNKKPEDIPIETLHRFSYLVNLKTALKIKAYPPLTILDFAEIINNN